jgi:hypothetical protein
VIVSTTWCGSSAGSFGLNGGGGGSGDFFCRVLGIVGGEDANLPKVVDGQGVSSRGGDDSRIVFGRLDSLASDFLDFLFLEISSWFLEKLGSELGLSLRALL